MPQSLFCNRRFTLRQQYAVSLHEIQTGREDPAVDRQVLENGSDDTMLVITSAGCNVLDYALSAPEVMQISAATAPFVPGLCTSCFVYIGRKLATRETTA